MKINEKLLNFLPPQWDLDEIKRAIPPSVFEHHPTIAVVVLVRDVTMSIGLVWAMSMCRTLSGGLNTMFQSVIWLVYWWFQGLVFTGIWVVGHECAHESFLPSKPACRVIGLICHTFLWTPHFSWKSVHQVHHRLHGLMDEDQHWIPNIRSELFGHQAHRIWDCLEDTPLLVLLKLIVQQLIGFPLYLLLHVTGPRQYPTFTSHFNPFFCSFKPHQRLGVFISDVALLCMAYILSRAIRLWGWSDVFLFYGVPCLLVSHWVTMIVYLHHTDRVVPHYRRPGWTYCRGAFATIDRDFLGWQGRFFLHDIAHFHTVHHLFPKIPFYNCELATKHLKELVGDDLQTRTGSVFKSLWDNYTSCQFVEDNGNILFYKDGNGQALRLDN
ncbi:fatty acid desaturase-domain-containing protein [Mycena olivaceomarginata]|nr:fatty acid desaturase-domain-containing protein [Mycena olivaceomarginata]